jgi:hypothetical protein
MGLDVYVGSLTRYYTRDWKTVVQRYGEQQGIPVQVVRPQGQNQAPPDRDTVLQIVESWREGLAVGLSEHFGRFASWDESEETPYFTDKPAWDGYACLLLLAAYDEHPEFNRPKQSTSEWDQDPAWRASVDGKFRSQYLSILTPEFWLPWDFNAVFQASDPGGREVCFGSTGGLLRQLRDLNGRTFRLDDRGIAEALAQGCEYGGPFEPAARFGLAIFLRLAQSAVLHTLPMKLDY